MKRPSLSRLTYYILLFSLFGFLSTEGTSCTSAKSSREQPVTIRSFMKSFPSLQLPYTYNEDSLLAKNADSLQLKTLNRAVFIPDSIRFPEGKKGSHVGFFAVGKGMTGKNKWLFIKTVTADSRKVYVLVYNQKDSLKAVKKVASMSGTHKGSTSDFKWTAHHLLNIYEKSDLGKGQVRKHRQVYSLSDDGHFNLILTNTERPNL